MLKRDVTRTAPKKGERRFRRYARSIEAPMVIRAQSAKQLSRPPSIRVFVIEEEGRVRDAAASMLLERGMIVEKAAKPDRMFRTTRRFRPDVIVLDDASDHSRGKISSLMPDILERFPGTKVIVTYGDEKRHHLHGLDPIKWGASAIVSKKDILRHRTLDEAVLKAAGRRRPLPLVTVDL